MSKTPKRIVVNCADYDSDDKAIQHAVDIVSKRKITVKNLFRPKPLVVITKGKS